MGNDFTIHGQFACFWKGPLSQWHPASFVYDRRKYCCAEQAMMFAKANVFGDAETAGKIMSTQNPAEHKKLGRLVKNFDAWKWNCVNADIVRDINIARFSQNPDLLEILFSTGDMILVEASPYDRIWGAGLPIDNPDLADPFKWVGKNKLGRVLTMVRDRIRKDKIFSVAATGHRPQKLYGYNLHDPRWHQLGRLVRNYLIRKIKEHGRVKCISGMALGVDQLFALVALKLRDQGYNIIVCCALPCRDQNRAWKSDEWWRDIMARADEHVFVHNGTYTISCMNERNKWMVNRADEVLAVWDGSGGGTGNCVDYARKKRKHIVNIYSGKEENISVTVNNRIIQQSLMS